MTTAAQRARLEAAGVWLPTGEYPLRRIPEGELARSVATVCRQTGLPHYHTYRSDKSEPGWPDEAIIAGDTLWTIEDKSDFGVMSEAQVVWLCALAQVRHLRAAVNTPSGWPALRDELLRGTE